MTSRGGKQSGTSLVVAVTGTKELRGEISAAALARFWCTALAC
jgi:hypothetical protein